MRLIELLLTIRKEKYDFKFINKSNFAKHVDV